MRQIILAVSLVLAMFAAGKNLMTVTYATHLHCESCVKKVMENISYVKGVKDLDVSLKENTIAVTFDASKTTAEKIQQEIKILGYTAEIVKTETPVKK